MSALVHSSVILFSERREVNLLVAAEPPQFGIWLIDQACVGNDPLAVEGAKAIADRWGAWPTVVRDTHGFRWKPVQRHCDDFGAVFIAAFAFSDVRVEQCF